MGGEKVEKPLFQSFPLKNRGFVDDFMCFLVGTP